MNFKLVRNRITFFLCVFAMSSIVNAAPNDFVYQGQIIKPDANPLEAASVTFTVQILSPAPSLCVLFEETHNLNMSGSNGLFSLPIGQGTYVGGEYSGITAITQTFNNAAAAVTPATCDGPNSYTAAAGDTRMLRVSFDDGGGPVVLNDAAIRSVPFAQYATNAAAVGGVPAANILRDRDDASHDLNQTNLEWIFEQTTRWPELQALINGTSSQYISSSPGATVNLNGQILDNIAAPSDANDATNKNYVDTTIGGQNADALVSAPTITQDGYVLSWNNTNNEYELIDGSAAFGDNLGNHTATANLQMGANYISNDGTASQGLSFDGSNNANFSQNLTVSQGFSVTNGINSGGNISVQSESEFRMEDNAGGEYMGLKAPATVTASTTLTLPDGDGGANQVLGTDGSGNLQWQTDQDNDAVDSVFGRTGAVVAAASDYDADQIDNTAAGNIAATDVQAAINELDTEKLALAGGTMTGALQMDATNEIRFADADSSNYVGFVAPAIVGSDQIWVLPNADGSANQVLATDASGGLFWKNDNDTAAPVDSVFGRTGAVTAAASDYDADQIDNTAAGNIAATDVQAAINELDTEKLALAGGTMTGDILMSNEGEVRYADSVGGEYAAIKSPNDLAANYTLTLPADDGAANEVLQTDGSGNLTWVAQTATAPVDSVFGRTGAVTAAASDYDANQIDNTAAGNIAATDVQAAINELDTEKVAKSGDSMSGNLSLQTESEVRFEDNAGGEYMGLKAPATVTASTTLTLPDGDGGANQVLGTDGSGNLQWQTDQDNDAVDSVFGRTGAVTAAASDYDADQIDNTAAGNIAATDVQAAINELDTEKLALAGGTMTGNLVTGTTANIQMTETAGTGELITLRAPADATAAYTLTLPVDDGGSGEVLQTNGSGVLSWVALGGGGDFFANGSVPMTGDLDLNAQSDARFRDSDSSHYAAIQAPATITTNYTLTLPADDGAANEVLQTDGSGTLSWVAQPNVPVDSVFGRTGAVVAAASDYDADQIDNTAAGNIAATDVQAAINELDTEKLALAGGTMTGDILMSNEGEVRYADSVGGEYAAIKSPNDLAANYTLTLPADDGAANEVLQTDGSGNLTWVAQTAAAPVDSVFGRTGAVTAAASDYDADQIDNTAAGNIAATDVQAAINELDTEKLALAGGTMTGNLVTGTTANIQMTETAGTGELITLRAPADATAAYTLTLPVDDGAANQVLQTDGSGALSWVAQTTAAPVDSVFGRTGAVTAAASDYDADQIDNVAAGDIAATDVQAAINELDTEKLAVAGGTMTGHLNLDNEREIRFEEATGNGDNYVGFKAPALLGGDLVWELPAADGSANQVLATDASGGLFWKNDNNTDAVDSVFGRTGAVVATASDYDANQIDNTAAGNIAATDVQAAINELDTEKLALAGGTMTGDILMSNEGEVRYADSVGGQYAAIKSPNDLAANYTLTLPADDGGAGEVLQTDGSGALSWVALGGGGDFFANGSVPMTGDLDLNAQSDARFRDSDSSHYAAIQAPATITTNYTLTLPADDGTSGQLLSTDGSGVLSWVNAGGVGDFLANGTVAMTGNLQLGSNRISNDGGAGEGLTFDTDGNATFGQNVELVGSDLSFQGSGTKNIVSEGAAMSIDLDADNNDTGEVFTITKNNGASELLRVNEDGDLGVGTSSVDAGAKLQVEGGAILAGPKGAGASDGGEIRFQELGTNGSNYVGFRAPDLLGGDLVWELPAADGSANQVLATDASGGLFWKNDDDTAAPVTDVFGRTGNVTAQASDYDANQIDNVAAGNIAATDVQAAINELDTEKLALAGGTMTGNLVTGTTANIQMTETAGTGELITLRAPADATAAYTLTLPVDDGTASQVLETDGSGNLSWVTPSSGVTDHGGLTGLLDDDHTQYALLAGRTGGQSFIGGDAANNDLNLESTSHATKGDVVLQPNGGLVGIGIATPQSFFHIHGGSENYSQTSYTTDATGSTVSDGFEVGYQDVTGAFINNFENTPMTFGTNGSERMRVEAGGDVGIGTNNPGTKLDVEGQVTVGPHGTGAGETGQVILEDLAAGGTFSATIKSPDTLASSYVLTLPVDDGAANEVLQTDGSGNLTWTPLSSGYSAGDTILAADGLVGTPGFAFNSDPNTGLYRPAADNIAIVTNGFERVRIENTGDVGIGTTDPAMDLHVYSSSGDVGMIPGFLSVRRNVSLSGGVLGLTNRDTPQLDSMMGQLIFGHSPTVNSVNESASIRGYAAENWAGLNRGSYITIQTALVGTSSPQERIRVTDSGDVGIGTNNPGTKLDVEGQVTVGPHGTGAGETGQVILEDLAAGGTFSATIKSPDTLASSYVLTLPVDDGTASQVLETDGSGNLSWVTPSSGVTDHGGLTGLLDDDHTQYVLLAGRAGGQSLNGGNAANDDLILDSTANATKGDIILQPTSGNIGIGSSTPEAKVDIIHDPGVGTDGFNAGSSPALKVSRGTGSFAGLMFGYWVDSGAETAGAIVPSSAGAGDIVFAQDITTENMRITNAGDVGIGTDSPGTKLDVEGQVTVGPHGTGAGETGQVILEDLAAGGTFSATIKSPDTLASSYVLTLPVDDGTANQVLQTNGSGALSWTDGGYSSGDIIQAADGNAGTRGFGFASDPNTGLWRPTTDTVRMQGGATGGISVSGQNINFEDNTAEIQSGRSYWVPGTETQPSVSFAGDVNTGLFSAAADSIGFTTFSVERMRLDANGDLNMLEQNEIRFQDSSGGDYVGFRAPTTVTSSQTYTLPPADGIANQVLQTNGSGVLSWATVSGSGYSAGDTILAANGSTGAPGLAFNSDTDTGIYRSGADQLAVSAGNNEIMTFGTSNVVATEDIISRQTSSSVYSSSSADPYPSGPFIATENQSNTNGSVALLQLITNNSSSNEQRAYFGATSNSGGSTYTPDIVIGQQTGTSLYNERMRIDSSGHVGIGTNSPNSRFQVHEASANTVYGLYTNSDTGATNSDGLAVGLNNNEDAMIWNAENTNIVFATNDSEQMRIDSSGDVGIGTNNPNKRLDVRDTNDNAHIHVTQTSGSSGGATMYVSQFKDTSPVTSATMMGAGSRGTFSSPSPLLNGDDVLAITASAASDTAWNQREVASIHFGAAENISNTTSAGNIKLSTTASGSTTPTERVRIDSNGNVGIGTTSVSEKLHTNGNIRSDGQIFADQNVISSGATVDFDNGNVQVLQSVGGSAITLNNMEDGASYTLIVTDTTSRTYTFTNCTNSHFSPANAATTASTHTTYTILKVTVSAATHCYISWITGFAP